MTTPKQAQEEGRQAYRDGKPIVDNTYLNNNKYLAKCYRQGWLAEQTITHLRDSLACAEHNLKSILEDEGE